MTKISWKITFLKFILILPGANELRIKYYSQCVKDYSLVGSTLISPVI